MTGSAAATGEFRKKNVLVAGAGRGIGKRIALGFARQGARVALVGRSKAEIDLAHIEIEQAGGNALRVRADVTDPEQVTLAVNRAAVTFGGPLDVLVCSAGIPGPLQPFLQTSVKAWAETIQVNLLGVTHACRAVLPSMIEKRAGKILVLTCDSDSLPKANFSAYTTSKTAVVRFVEALAARLRTTTSRSTASIQDPLTRILPTRLLGRKAGRSSGIGGCKRDAPHGWRFGGSPISHGFFPGFRTE